MAPALRRRDVIAGGGLVAVGGILVACGGADSPSEDTASAEAAPSPSQTPDTATPEAAPSSAEETDVEEAEGAEEAASQEAVDGIASVDEIPVEGGVVISDPPVVLVQPTSGDVKGFSAVCPHQGCLVSSVESNEILCPCHGSLFSATDGSVITGPASEGLPAVPVEVQGNSVVLA
jgi:Rieske Fe-S protein